MKRNGKITTSKHLYNVIRKLVFNISQLRLKSIFDPFWQVTRWVRRYLTSTNETLRTLTKQYEHWQSSSTPDKLWRNWQMTLRLTIQLTTNWLTTTKDNHKIRTTYKTCYRQTATKLEKFDTKPNVQHL